MLALEYTYIHSLTTEQNKAINRVKQSKTVTRNQNKTEIKMKIKSLKLKFKKKKLNYFWFLRLHMLLLFFARILNFNSIAIVVVAFI